MRQVKLFQLLIAVTYLVFSCGSKQEAKHLFILSGQSNMEQLHLVTSFNPMIEGEFGKGNVLIVKDAHSGQPIKKWLKPKTSTPNVDESHSNFYDSLMDNVFKTIDGQELLSITFIWMQGESDAKYGLGLTYESNLIQLYSQLVNDLDTENIHFIIGRLNDFDLQNRRYPHWTMVRTAQMNVAASQTHYCWVNTDDLNDGLNRQGLLIENDLHLSENGYRILGERFAKEAIRLIKANDLTTSTDSVR